MPQQHLDQFFTPAAVARQCYDDFLACADLPPGCILIEPSAGGRAFYDLLPPACRLGFDLDPKFAVNGVKQADFLQLTPMFSDEIPEEPFAVIGNPPFGSRGRLAREFIEHSLEIGAQAVGFIVPPSAITHPPAGGHEVLRKPLTSPVFETTGGMPVHINGCLFVVYKAGPGATPGGLAPWAWREYLRIRPVRSGEPDPEGCDMFLPRAMHYGSRRRMKAYPDRTEAEMRAINVIKDKDRVLPWLMDYDWLGNARTGTNQSVYITNAVLSKALADGGFL